MNYQINFNAVNQVEAGSLILREGDPVDCICMILKGKAAAESRGSYTVLSAGCFLGISDIFLERYCCNYTATENVTLYAFPIKGKDSIRQILGTKKEYGGLMTFSLSRHVSELKTTYEDLMRRVKEIYEYVKACDDTYRRIGGEEKIKPKLLQLAHDMKAFRVTREPDARKLSYYEEAAHLSLDKHKEFFIEAPTMVLYHVEEQAGLVNELMRMCRESAEYLEDALYLLMNKGEQNLFLYVSAMLIEAKRDNKATKELSELLDQIVDKINEVDIYFSDKVGRTLFIDRERMEETYHAVISGKAFEEEQKPSKQVEIIKSEDTAQIMKTLKDSLSQILTFSGWGEEKCREFSEHIEAFVKLTNRNSNEDHIRRLKHGISEMYFDLYQDIFLKAHGKDMLPLAVQWFLDFGFVDERLIDEEHFAQLNTLKRPEQMVPCKVYMIREWLTLVYDGKKEPSKSEFDLDYGETLRDMRKHGALSESEMQAATEDKKRKLEFEIHNMFTTNCRLVNGQISTFVPILYKDALIKPLSSSRLSGHKVNDTLSHLTQNDPLIFYREMMYSDLAHRIDREYVMRQVFPEFILLPTNGANGIMWQDIEGKRRDTPGRFLFPIFFEGRLEDVMLRVLGRFRWELCRSVQGTTWNNIQVKSLTSEYSDYLDYYRKNRDLSEERREKIKMQLQRAKGNSREAFVQDYELWVKNESGGAVRLNKVAREILATYCPFSKVTRKFLAGQPIFDDATARFERNLQKKVYELDMHYRTLEKDGIVITEEMKSTLELYRNM